MMVLLRTKTTKIVGVSAIFGRVDETCARYERVLHVSRSEKTSPTQ